MGVNGRALVETVKAVELTLGGRRIDAFTQDGHIKTRALHLHELVDQHIAGGAQLALKAQSAPQQKGLAVSAAIGEFGEIQVDAANTLQVQRARINVVRYRQHSGRVNNLVFWGGDDFHKLFLALGASLLAMALFFGQGVHRLQASSYRLCVVRRFVIRLDGEHRWLRI
jgi:hypothetical protein